MALTKVRTGGLTADAVDNTILKLDDNYALTGNVTGAGTIVQVVNVTSVAMATGTTVLPLNDTIPQNDEGDEYLTQAITPTNASNKLLIEVSGLWNSSVAGWISIALFQDSTANALAANTHYGSQATANVIEGMKHFMTAGTTSETTFKIRVGPHSSATVTMNGENGGRRFGGVQASQITIMEIAV